MILLPELLEDKTYAKFFKKQPSLPIVARRIPPYRLWVQLEPQGRWKKKDIGSYQSGVKWFFINIDRIHDGALAIMSTQTPPPNRLVKVKRNGVLLTKVGSDGVERAVVKEAPWRLHLPEGERKHLWCPYCRRPTVFTWFSKHHNMPIVLQPEYSRCTICGLREEHLRKDWQV